ncbi:hypothetical protein FIE12Z_54 [Fusarium flagelliforme]|uniref:Uncharacterized protein n=1 Tax=Fusarium flagelliforme TaxID=2675880 RepID=A0A395N7S0_9HYPO|nr:hypothetical protein FIE12Z_54 [Fusarium flagelliforme]
MLPLLQPDHKVLLLTSSEYDYFLPARNQPAAPVLPDVPSSLPINPKKPRLNGPGNDDVDSDDDELAGLASLSKLHPSLFVQSKIKELPSLPLGEVAAGSPPAALRGPYPVTTPLTYISGPPIINQMHTV